MNISTVHETITARLTTLITAGDCSENGIYYISATTTKVTHTHWRSVDLCFEHVSYELKTEAFVIFNVMYLISMQPGADPGSTLGEQNPSFPKF